jgi:hypothetical protein
MRRIRTEAANEPEDDQDDQYEAKHAAKSRPAISPVAVISASAAKEQEEDDDEKQKAHAQLPEI